MHLGKFVHTETGRIIMSIILGLGLASLFRTICEEGSCRVFHAPPLDDITDKIFETDDNKCVKYSPVSTKCSSNKKIITFA